MNIIFSHANGYPAPVYGVLFAALKARGVQVAALDKFGHDPRFPIQDNWASLTQELLSFATTQLALHREPAWLVGHSLGGYLSLMAAGLQPGLAKGVVLLDSPILGGWRAGMVRVSKGIGMVGTFSPGKVSRRRRQSWPSLDAVLAHLKGKRVFAQWHPQVLEDYATHGTHEVVT